MKKISYWAKQNVQKARICIIGIHLILAILAWYTGNLFYSIHVIFPNFMLLSTLWLFLVAVFLYPRGCKKAYWRQKTCDLVIGSCSFMVMCFFSNNFHFFSIVSTNTYGSSAESIPVISKNAASAEISAPSLLKEKNNLTKQERKSLKREIKKQLKTMISADGTGKKHIVAKILLIALSLICSAGLLYLLAFLACSIACGGAEIFAFIILVLGITGTVFLSVFTIKKILSWGKAKVPEHS